MIKLNSAYNSEDFIEDFIEDLTAEEAFLVLRKLFLENPNLKQIIYNTALKVVTTVDAEEIANELCDDLLSVEVEDLYDRSGSGRYGYVHPHDEAWVMFDEQIEPYLDEMEKYHKRELPHIVKEYCIGIIKGLMEFSEEATTEFSDWVADAPSDYISRVVDSYKKMQPDMKDVEEVMKYIKKG